MGKKRAKEHSKELHELRRANQQLQRQVTQLRKQLSKKPEEPDHEELDDMTYTAIVQDNKCPQCCSPLSDISLGSRLITSCNSCNYRIVK